MPVDRRKLAIGGLVLAGVLFVSLNTFSALSLRGQQLDLTQARQYTLSQGTTKLLAELPEPVTLRLYVSKTVRDTNPFLASYATRVRDLLQTYAQRSDGKLKVEYIDPEPFSQAEDRAVGFGLQPITLDNGGTTGYFGIAGTNSTDDVDAIPVLSPDREQFLEYDLTRLVYNLANPQKPEVAMISGLPVNGDPASQYQPWKIYTELGQFYDIHYMDGDITSFDKNTKLLVIIFPQKLSDKTLYAIDQFVLHGGKAMVFVDPQSEAAAMRQRQQIPGPMASDLEPLFKAWGVEMVPAKVVGDPQYARQVQFPNGGQTQIVDYLPWLSLDQSAFADDPTVAQLNRINVETAGILEPLKGATTTFTPLLHSSRQAQEIPVDKVAMYPDPPSLLRDFKPGGEELVMAARITGPAKSAFADALPKGVEAGKDRLTQSKGPIAVEVVADTDMLDNRSWLASQAAFGQDMEIPVADNAELRRQLARLSERQRGAGRSQGPPGLDPALHAGPGDPPPGPGGLPGEGAGSDAEALEPAGQALEAPGRRQRLGRHHRLRRAAKGDRRVQEPAPRHPPAAPPGAARAAAGHRGAAQPRALPRHRGGADPRCDLRDRPRPRAPLPLPPPLRRPRLSRSGGAMQPRSFILLGAATLVCVLLAGWSVAHRAMPGSGTEVDKPLVPELASRINDVALVSVTADGQTTTIRQGDKGWTVDQAGGYPADASKIQALALALANTHLVEAKTAQEKLLPRLDLGDPTEKTAKSVLVKLEDAKGKDLAAVVVGKAKYGLYGPGSSGSYVRLDGKDQAWLADRAIDVPKTPLDWVTKQIIDIPRDQIARVTLRPGTPDAVAMARPSPEATALELAGVPEGRTADAQKIDELASSVSGLELDGVKPAKEVTFPAGAAQARFETVDGLVVVATLAPEGTGDKAATWARFDVSAEAPMTAAAPPEKTAPPQAAAAPAASGAPAAGTMPAATADAGSATATTAPAEAAKTATATAATPPASVAPSKDVVEKAKALQAKLDGWAFKLPQYDATKLQWKQDDLLKSTKSTS